METKKIGLINVVIRRQKLGFIREICEDWSELELPFVLNDSMNHLESGMLYLFTKESIHGHHTAIELEEPNKTFYDQLDLKIFSRQRASIKANRHNLDTVNFILKNDLDSSYYREAQAIRKINHFLTDEFEDFDFRKAVEEYKIELKFTGVNRVGKEDRAWIAIESNNYWRNPKWDSYLSKLLPLVNNIICEDSCYSRWEVILDELKSSVDIKKLELEAAQMEIDIKRNIFSRYDKNIHKNALISGINNIRDQILSEVY